MTMKTYSFSANYVGGSIRSGHLMDKSNRNTKLQPNEFFCLVYCSFI